MPRRLITLSLFAVIASAQIWPEKWAEHRRVKAEAVAPADAELFAEYAGEVAEKALYDGPAGRFSGIAWRLKDSTGALAWYQAQRPANAVPVRNQPLASTTPGGLWLVEKNHVFSFDGWRPTAKELGSLFSTLPKLRSGGGLPVFITHLPEEGRVRNSERYVVGVTSLARFLPQIPGELPGFEDGAELQVARFAARQGGDYTVAVLNYPTQQVARERAAGLSKIPGLVQFRSGPYLAVALNPPDSDEARRILEKVEYRANFTWNQATKLPPMPPVGDFLVGVFQLTGVLLVVCVGGGIAFAFLWVYLRRRQAALVGNESPMTMLNIAEE